MPETTQVNVVDPREAAHLSGEDYAIIQQNGLYQWQGLDSDHHYEGYQSDGDGWRTPEAAQADALYCLMTLDGDDHDTAIQILTSWRFFSLEVLNNCDRENAAGFDFSDLEATAEDLPLSAGEIRVELEALANEGNATPDDYLRLYRAWQAVKEATPRSYYPVIVDRLNALLYAVVPLEGSAGEIGQLARSTIAAMNSVDLALDELRAARNRPNS